MHLTPKEVEILKFLYNNANRVVSRKTLLDEVWGYNAGVTTHTLETHVYKLRQKIEVDSSNCRLLMSVPGGYQLNLIFREVNGCKYDKAQPSFINANEHTAEASRLTA